MLFSYLLFYLLQTMILAVPNQSQDPSYILVDAAFPFYVHASSNCSIKHVFTLRKEIFFVYSSLYTQVTPCLFVLVHKWV